MINLSTLKDLSRVKKYPKNTVLTGENEAAELILLIKGVAGVYANHGSADKELVCTIGPGGFTGEMELFLGKRTPYTAVALTDVIAVPVGRDDIAAFLRDKPEIAMALLKDLCVRLDGAMTAYEKQAGHPWAGRSAFFKGISATKPEKRIPAPHPSAALAAQDAQAAPSPAPAPAPAKDAAAHAPAPDAAFILFPEGHGSYQLPLDAADRMYLMEKGYTCPICKKEFRALAVRTSKLVQEGTDGDMRHRYKGVEPLYYDVATCPHCLYSALAETFSKPDIPRADLSELAALKTQTQNMFGTDMDTVSVFAGYYLALFCAPRCFARHHLAEAKLLLKMSRLYQDCGDRAMEEQTAKRALDAYLYVYLNEQSDANQDQQLCIMLGELYLKLGDLKSAREYLFKAKTNRMGSPVLKTHAETRLSYIKAMEAKA